jgi:hypothetical protein
MRQLVLIEVGEPKVLGVQGLVQLVEVCWC